MRNDDGPGVPVQKTVWHDDARGVVVVVINYAIQGNYCCPSCDRSTLMQSTEQTVDFVCINCDERIREWGGKYV